MVLTATERVAADVKNAGSQVQAYQHSDGQSLQGGLNNTAQIIVKLSNYQQEEHPPVILQGSLGTGHFVSRDHQELSHCKVNHKHSGLDLFY